MIVGLSSLDYTTIEASEVATVCVDVLNPADVGALRPFTVALLPEQGNLALFLKPFFSLP